MAFAFSPRTSGIQSLWDDGGELIRQADISRGIPFGRQGQYGHAAAHAGTEDAHRHGADSGYRHGVSGDVRTFGKAGRASLS